ncbi:hypothetical protein BT93_H3125 [Corymbia citriodora subsp. variegata]|nr:hypothetical protein BT93_H3125 [Corymbia citriodora subsp. variegata]
MHPPGPNEADWIVQVNESLNFEFLPSDGQQVPAHITDLNPDAYLPQVVSFGPYHHGKDHLLPMEEHKHRTLHRFLKRSGKCLESFLDSLREVAQALEESYDALDPMWKVGSSEDAASKFLKLMITDGCFLLEILRTTTEEKLDYAVNDPIFSSHGKLHIMPHIKRDMLMLENQLPMLVLHRLVAVESDGKKNPYSDNLVFSALTLYSNNTTVSKDIGKCLHVLDVYRKSLLLPEKKSEEKKSKEKPKLPKEGSKDGEEMIWSATKLHEHGIKFSKSDTSSLKDISFASGVLRLPMITVDDTTWYVFLNLILFEHFHVGAGNEVTSYIFLMDKIIDKEGDVALLEAQGIIQNAIGSDKAVAELFNSLCKEVTLEPESGLDPGHAAVRKYCKNSWFTWIAALCHTYFGSPWSVLSLVAAILLFAIAIIQTAYTMIYH